MNHKYDGKVAIVTGASKGIGRAICVELAACGYHVVINYRSDVEGAVETLERVQDAGSTGKIMPFDVAEFKETQEAVDDILASYETIDILVNNAGIAADALFIMMPRRDWDNVIHTSLRGFYNVTKPVLEKMILQKSGAVVSIASVSAFIGNRGQANYSASKAGLIGLTKTTARELATRGITVNAIAPGFIETDMTASLSEKARNAMLSQVPIGRAGQPEDIATVVAFLASESASYITGQVIHVSGGMYM